MIDGPHNERARQKHRRLLKEVCGCKSVPSNLVIREPSCETLTNQKSDDNNFGWTVCERTNAAQEYGKLKHQKESFQPTDSKGNQITSRCLKPGRSRGHDSSPTSTATVHSKGPVFKTQWGPRNEPARLRHRQQRKEEGLSLPSIGSDISEEEEVKRELNEENHFGWAVVSKAYGDPEFERLMQYHEKPDIASEDFPKRTYVLYMKEGTVLDRDAYLKESKEDGQKEKDRKKGLPIGDLVSSDKTDKSGKKKNLINEFFFLPFKERSRSPSPKSGKSRPKLLGQLADHTIAPKSGDNNHYGDISAKSSKETIDKNTKNTNKLGSHRRFLRAGGDSTKKNITECETPSNLSKDSEKVNHGSNFFKKRDARTRRVICTEYLLETPSGTNEFLFLNRRNIENRQKTNYKK